MSSSLSPSAQRVQNALKSFGVEARVLELKESTRTASEAAEAVGCDVAQIVKSLIFKGKESQQPILVVASGSNRVDEKKLRQLAGEKIGRADADFVREKTGFAIGGVPPLGHLETIRTYIDADLLQYRELWAAAGTPNALFRLAPEDLQKITGGFVAEVKE